MPEFNTLTFHERAVRTPSHADIGEMRSLLVIALADAGMDPRVDDAGNVIASRGTGDPHLVLNTHIDTVPPHIPYERDGDIVRGRGSCDAKGALAALVDVFLATDTDTTGGKLTLAVTPDEETYSTGAAALRAELDANGYIVGEPTGLDICTAAKGRFEGTAIISGEPAHAAKPASGTDAIRAAADLIQALDSFDAERGPGPHDQLGAPTLTATTVEGGTATNQVAGECQFTVDRRSVPPETAAGFRDALTTHLGEHLRAGDCSFALTERDTPFLEAFATDPDTPLVRVLRDAGAGGPRPFTAATEASYFAADAPTVIFGPGVLADERGPVAHAEREYIRRSDIRRAAKLLREAVPAFLAGE